MALAERDRHRGELEPQRQAFVYQALHDVVENLGERVKLAEIKQEQTEAAEANQPPVRPGVQKRVLCIPAFDEADEIASVMLKQVLEADGMEAQTVTNDALANEKVDVIHGGRPDCVCISALPPLAVMHSRYLCKRLLNRFPDLRVIVGLWNVTDLTQARDRMRTCGTPVVLSTFSQVVAEIRG
jgi:hypothetical protein